MADAAAAHPLSLPAAPGRDHAPVERIPALDGLRGIAILLVLVWHYVVEQMSTAGGGVLAVVAETGLRAMSWSWAGVDLFFVLSGFLIGGTLIDHRREPGFLPRFYLRRAARLMPLYLLVVAGYGAALAAFQPPASRYMKWLLWGGPDAAGQLPVWSYLLYVQNVVQAIGGQSGGHWLAMTWSLAIEEQFYLLAPILIWLVPRRLLPHVLSALIAAAILARVTALAVGGSALPIYISLPCRWDSLLIGVLVAFAVREPAWRGWIVANHARALRVAVMGTASVVVVSATSPMVWWHPLMLGAGFTVLAVISAAALLAALYSPNPWLKAVLCQGWLQRIGVVSYGIYLLHQLVYGLLHHLLVLYGPGPEAIGIASALFAALLTYALAELSWRRFEQPIIAAARQLAPVRPATAR